MSKILLSTMNEVPGHQVVEIFGVVRGLTVRSSSMVGNMVAGVEAVFGGRNLTFTELCEATRSEATRYLTQHAAETGANAVLALRYDTNEVMQGITEVLAYGTAVWVEPMVGQTPVVKISVPDERPALELAIVSDESSQDVPDDNDCLSCGKHIPPSAAACPHCGWTWAVKE